MADNAPVELLRAIINNMSGGDGEVPNTWTSLAIIIESFEGKLNSIHGYAYSPDGTITPFAADPWKTIPALETYLEGVYKPGEKPPVAILLQFDRTSGAYEMTYEDNDEERWKVTPKNFKEIREELRPKLG